jgi:hypothetical protein
VPDLHLVYRDDGRRFRSRLTTEDDDMMTSTRQAHGVLSQHTLRATDHFPRGNIGE